MIEDVDDNSEISSPQLGFNRNTSNKGSPDISPTRNNLFNN